MIEEAAIDSSRVKACTLYRGGELAGVPYIKTHRLRDDQTQYPIMFCCAPKYDIPLIKSYGRTISQNMSYVGCGGINPIFGGVNNNN